MNLVHGIAHFRQQIRMVLGAGIATYSSLPCSVSGGLAGGGSVGRHGSVGSSFCCGCCSHPTKKRFVYVYCSVVDLLATNSLFILFSTTRQPSKAATSTPQSGEFSVLHFSSVSCIVQISTLVNGCGV